MKLQLSDQELEFQQQVRGFLDAKFTPELAQRIANKSTLKEASIEWQKHLYDKGWVAPSWPVEYGGTDWSLMQKFIFSNELAKAGAPEPLPFGVKMVGPVIYTFANDEQKEKFLPGILKSDTWWCQGYSEPGAGSDLSSLRMKAEKQGDHYLVNGSKIWTSYAQYADWIFCLVRTSNTEKPQHGISFLLIDMQTPGIKVRPIVTIDAEHHLNEVIFEDVKVPVDNLVGEEGKGWTYAKFLLNHERGSVAGVTYCKKMISDIKEKAKAVDLNGEQMFKNPIFQQRLGALEIESMALECTELRILEKMKNGQDAMTDASQLKILGTELQQKLQSLALEVAGVYTSVVDRNASVADQKWGHNARRDYLFGRAASIYAGSNEVQRNIIAKLKFNLL